MLLGFGISIGELLLMPVVPLGIGGVLLFFAIKRIKSDSARTGATLELPDYVKRLGCLGYAGVGFLLIGLMFAAIALLGILAAIAGFVGL